MRTSLIRSRRFMRWKGCATEAFEWLERAIALGNENQLCFENDPNWATLRSDEQFQNLMARVRASHAT